MKTVGVLGGMGPDATVLFFQRLVELTPAERDQEHLPILIYNNPQIPDRTRAITQGGESPVKMVRESLRVLEQAGADFICIPCNTVHYFYDDFHDATKLPILHLIELVVEAVLAEVPDIRKVGLLATRGTVRINLYHDAFAEYGIDVIAPHDEEQTVLQNTIHALKSKERDAAGVERLGKRLIDRGAQAILLGCTELGLVLEQLSLSVPVVDSIGVLAEKAVRVALRD